MKRKVMMMMLALLTGLMALTLGACGENADPAAKEQTDKTSSLATTAPTEASGTTTANPESAPESAPAPEEAPVASGPSKLLYLGHASVRIETGSGKVIYIDPYAGEDYSKPADLILVTHLHADHYGIDKMPRNDGCKVIESLDAYRSKQYKEFEVHGIKIRAVPAYNSTHPLGTGVGYILEFDGIKLYHAGDTSKVSEMAELADENLDFALLPMDNVYNMGPEEATECAGLIKAKQYIPIHTGPDGIFSEENIAEFEVENKLVLKPGEEVEMKAE